MSKNRKYSNRKSCPIEQPPGVWLQMEHSASYIAIKAMLRQGQVTIRCTELEEYPDMFEKKQLISPSEHNALLGLTWKLGMDK